MFLVIKVLFFGFFLQNFKKPLTHFSVKNANSFTTKIKKKNPPVPRSVAKLCPTLYNPMDCSTPDFTVLHHLPELAQTHIHWVGDAIQRSHPLLPLFSSCPQSFSASSSYLLVLNEFLETRLSLYPKFQIKFFYQKPCDNTKILPLL